MDCQWMTKVSQLIDQELPDDEAAAVNSHLAECSLCRQAQTEFLKLRREFKQQQAIDPISQRRALNNILAREDDRIWQRKIAAPAPVLALLICAAFSAGIITIRYWPHTTVDDQRAAPAAPLPGSNILANYDKGARPFIEVVKKRQSIDNGGEK